MDIADNNYYQNEKKINRTPLSNNEWGYFYPGFA